MCERFYLWLFILLIPAFVVLGHDSYIAFGETEQKINDLKHMQFDDHNFAFSDLGYLWIAYAPGSLNMLRDMISSENWEGILAPLIEQKAIFLALIPAVIFTLFHIIESVIERLTVLRTKKSNPSGGDFLNKRREKAGQKKYSRK